MTTWIVTGGAGFIGSNFVRHALANGDARIVVVDKLTYAGNLESLADVSSHERFHFVKADIADRAAVEQIVREHHPDAILNFAAETHVDRSIDGPAAFVQTNLVGTFELLEASRQYLARLAPAARERFRFLHVSTDEVYGSLGPEGAFSETTPYEPNSPYSASKAGADHLVRAYHASYGLPTLISNCSNNYGPYQFPEKLIPLCLVKLLAGEQLPIYGDGLNVRDWIRVEDHCRGIERVLERGRPSETYNLGGDGEHTNLETVRLLCRLVDRAFAEDPALSTRFRSAPPAHGERCQESIGFVKDRPGHDRRYAIDATKARRELGYRPKVAFERGLEAAVRWYLDNEPWWRAVMDGSYRDWIDRQYSA